MSGKRDELLKRLSDCNKSGSQHTLDPSIDDGKWFSAKVLKENAKVQANCSLSSLPFVPSTGWRAIPMQNIPSLFNYGHVHYYALESVQDINGAEEIERWTRTHDGQTVGKWQEIRGFRLCARYHGHGKWRTLFVRAHVWPSMRTELPHNIIVVISVNSGAVQNRGFHLCRQLVF